MGLNTRQEIESKLIAEMVAAQDEVTVFEPKTAIRGFITSVAGTLRELWNDLYRMQRKVFLNTASGTDLDELGAERGITRRGAAKAGVLLTFTGTSGTTIAKNTPFSNPFTYLSYVTQTEITLGAKNPDLAIDTDDTGIRVKSEVLSDNVWALCTTAGTKGNTQVNSITRIDTPITGVISVTNHSPARGGADAESDSLFRERIRNQISILNQATPAFYEALCKELNPRVIKVKTKKDNSRPDSVKLIIVTSDGAPLTEKDLEVLAAQVMEKHRAFTNVVCKNVIFSYITISERVKLFPGYTIKDVLIRTADVCADFLNFRSWDFGKSISIDNVFSICDTVQGVEDIELASFRVKSGSLKNASVTQILYPNQEISASTEETVSVSASTFAANSLINKFVRIIHSDKSLGETKQISSNDDKTITIHGHWRELPVSGTDKFHVIELYRYASSTEVLIEEDSLPYFDGLEITDINAPSNLSVASGIKNVNTI
ncbi:MAG: hypothetical protein EHM58_00515 [Ignavibacteriae bacterium]|nr:MAG: hypothetical protein EHM58_00515 [Ignavibacteriota bacterium]